MLRTLLLFCFAPLACILALPGPGPSAEPRVPAGFCWLLPTCGLFMQAEPKLSPCYQHHSLLSPSHVLYPQAVGPGRKSYSPDGLRRVLLAPPVLLPVPPCRTLPEPCALSLAHAASGQAGPRQPWGQQPPAALTTSTQPPAALTTSMLAVPQNDTAGSAASAARDKREQCQDNRCPCKLCFAA